MFGNRPPAEEPVQARLPRLPRLVTWVVAVLVVVEFLQWTVVQPADVQATLGFQRVDLELGRWWTTLTFPLVHRDLTLLLLNVHALVVFGSRLEGAWGARRFLWFLVLAGLGGWVLQLISGSDGMLIGASAAALGALAAYAMRWGDERHGVAGGFEVQGRWLTVMVGAMILLVGLRAGDGGGIGFLAHLGGVVTAWSFVRATPVLLVERLREGVSALPDEPPEDQPPRAFPKSPRGRGRETIDDVVSRMNAQAARRALPRREPRPEPRPEAQPEVRSEVRPEVTSDAPSLDAILDKISAQGIDQLTAAERRLLDEYSRRRRDG